MTTTAFDAGLAVRFDLSSGSVHVREGARLVLLPAATFETLERKGSPELLSAMGEQMGDALGSRLAHRMGGAEAVRTLSLDAFVHHLAGEMAIMGCGCVTLERWGKALVLALEGSPLPEQVAGPLVASLVARATGRTAETVLLGRQERTVRVLVTSARAAERATRLLSQGMSWGDVLSSLHQAEPS